MTTDSQTIGTDWQQNRAFPPPPEFTQQANANDPGSYAWL
jgi:hypothetical protein